MTELERLRKQNAELLEWNRYYLEVTKERRAQVERMQADIERLLKAEAEASLNHRIYYARVERLQAAVDGLEEENDALREALEMRDRDDEETSVG